MVLVSVSPSVYSKVEEFHREGKYCDVSILVQGRTFKCHRLILAAASSYFDSMFCGNFKESHVEEFHLYDIDPEVFEEVLQSIYNGDLNITESNAFKLLRISEFLSILNIRDSCIEFILANMDSVDDVIQIFVWARRMNILTLIDPLLQRISTDFIGLSENTSFLEMPFEDLHEILARRSTQSSALFNAGDPLFERISKELSDEIEDPEILKMQFEELHGVLPRRFTQSSLLDVDDLLVDALVRWLHYSYSERKKYFEILGAMIPSAKVSTEYSNFLSRKYKLPLPISEEQNASNRESFFKTYITLSDGYSPDDDNLPSASFADHQFSTNHSSIHWYFKETIFSINKYRPDGFISPVNECKQFKSMNKKNLISSSESDYVYRMYRDDELDGYKTNLSFRVYSSIDLSQSNSQNLCPPPVVVRPKGALDETSKQMYFFMSGFGKNPLYASNYKAFTDNELDVGVFYYNCERDEWFTLSLMKLEERIRTRGQLLVDGNLVYFISSGGDVQACDIRSSQHLKLPSTINRHNSCFSSCVLNGKIYVAGAIEVFDPTMQKWEILRPSFNVADDDFWTSCVVPYDNRLWCFDENLIASGCGQLPLDDTLSIEVYNPNSREWHKPHNSLIGRNIIAKCGLNETSSNDGVIVSKCK